MYFFFLKKGQVKVKYPQIFVLVDTLIRQLLALAKIRYRRFCLHVDGDDVVGSNKIQSYNYFLYQGFNFIHMVLVVSILFCSALLVQSRKSRSKLFNPRCSREEKRNHSLSTAFSHDGHRLKRVVVRRVAERKRA